MDEQLIFKNKKLFKFFCKKSNDLEQILYKIIYMDDHFISRNQKLFLYFCKNGHIDDLVNILHIENNNINLNIYDEYAFRIACINGHINIIKHLLCIPDNNINTNVQKYYAFRKACKNNHIDVLKFLLDNMNEDNKNELMIIACRTNNLLIIKYFSENEEIEKMVCSKLFIASHFNKKHDISNYLFDKIDEDFHQHIDHQELFPCCCRENMIRVVKSLHKLSKKFQNFILKLDEQSFSSICKDGHFEIVKYLLENLNDNISIDINYTDSFFFSCVLKHYEVSSYLYTHATDKSKKKIIDINGIFNYACENNNINVVKYLINLPENNIDISNDDYHVFHIACERKNFDIVEYLTDIIPSDDVAFDVQYNFAFINACKTGNIDIIKCMLNKSKNKLVVHIDKYVILSCQYGYIEIVKYLTDFLSDEQQNVCYNKSFQMACDKGNLDIVMFLVEMENNNININYDNDCSFCSACYKGHIEIVKYLLSIPNNNININCDDNGPFCSACYKGHIEIVKYLLSIPNNNININCDDDGPFCSACHEGHIEIVKYLLSIPNNNININSNDDYPFYTSCEMGHIEIVKYLLNIPNNNININVNNDYPFYTSCEMGHVEIVEYLLNVQNNNININSLNDFPFRSACLEGHVEIVKYLLNIPNNNININSNEEFAFCSACSEGHVEIVKLLLSVPDNNINITIDDDYSFRSACSKGYVDISTKLSTICDRYNLVVENNEIISWYITLIPKNTKSIDSEIIECPICIEKISNVITDCNHQLCIDCCQHINKSKICHMCRSDITEFYFINKN
jgi:ankyrin repeat protein